MQVRLRFHLAERLIFEISPEYRRLRVTIACEQDGDRTSCSSLAEIAIVSFAPELNTGKRGHKPFGSKPQFPVPRTRMGKLCHFGRQPCQRRQLRRERAQCQQLLGRQPQLQHRSGRLSAVILHQLEIPSSTRVFHLTPFG